MAIEKKWPAVSPRLLTQDGDATGVVNVANASGFKVKQAVVIQAGTNQVRVQVKRFISNTSFIVGPTTDTQGRQSLTTRANLTGFTVAAGAFVYAEEQDKAVLKPDDIWQAVYRQEPGTTIGVELNDEFGNPYGPSYPLPVTSSGGLAPAIFDEVDIIRDTDGDAIQYQFLDNSVLESVVNVTYDSNKNPIKYKKG